MRGAYDAAVRESDADAVSVRDGNDIRARGRWQEEMACGAGVEDGRRDRGDRER